MVLNITMDTSKLISDVKRRFQQHENKLYLQEKYKNQLQVVSQGGMWKITTDFLAFLASAPPTIILEDVYGNPIKVDTHVLKEDSWKVYNNVMDSWHEEYTATQNNR